MKGEKPDRVVSTREALLHLLKFKGPMTAAEFAAHLGITPVAVRQQLQVLEEQSLVKATKERQPIGRPARRWSLTEAGQALFPDRHGELAEALFDAISATYGGEGMQRLMEERARRQIQRYRRLLPDTEATLEERVEALAEIRGREGYMTEWSRVGEGRWRVVENHCPICSAARTCEHLCDAEPRVFEASLGENAEVRRIEHILDGSRRCVYEIAEVEGRPVGALLSPVSRGRPAVDEVALKGREGEEEREGKEATEARRDVSVLVTKPAPDFTAKAVMPDGRVQDVSLSDYRGRFVLLIFYPLDFSFVCPTEIVAFSEAASQFEELGVQLLACSVDSHCSHLAWRKLPRQQGGIGEIEYPLVSDLTRSIARDYDVLLDSGVALRGLFLIDDRGIVRHQVVNDLPLGRSVEEALRMVKALESHEQCGQVCSEEWQREEIDIQPDSEVGRECLQVTNA